MMRSDDELTPEEQDALGRLPRTASPAPELEQATVAALVSRGLLGRPRRRIGAPLALAASLLLFAAGLALGRFGAESSAALTDDGRPRFALFLYEGPEYQQPAPGEMDARVREYATWARTEHAGGTIEGGEKLKEEDAVAIEPDGSARVVSPQDQPRLGGYFLIRAADQHSALAIARSCPHVRYGGRIVLREIDPT